jgi:hypothetical protein
VLALCRHVVDDDYDQVSHLVATLRPRREHSSPTPFRTFQKLPDLKLDTNNTDQSPTSFQSHRSMAHNMDRVPQSPAFPYPLLITYSYVHEFVMKSFTESLK